MKKLILPFFFFALFFVFLSLHLLIMRGLLSDFSKADDILYILKVTVSFIFATQIIIALLFLLVTREELDIFFSVVVAKELTWVFWLLFLGLSQIYPFTPFGSLAISIYDILWYILIVAATVFMFIFEARFIHKFNKDLISRNQALLLSVVMNVGGLGGLLLVFVHFLVL